MSKMPWYRMYAEAVDDEKLRLLAFEDRWHFVALCCLMCAGLLDEPDTDLRHRKVSIKLGLRPNELDEVKRRLMEVGLVDRHMRPASWKKRQFISDLADPTAAERMRRYRENKRNERNGTVTLRPPETDTDTDTEKEDIGRRRTADRFPEFWKTYPKKRKRKEALRVWQSKGLDAKADELIADVENRKLNDGRWLDGFAPDPTTYLRGERWTDEVEAPRAAKGTEAPKVAFTKELPQPEVERLARLYGVSLKAPFEDVCHRIDQRRGILQ